MPRLAKLLVLTVVAPVAAVACGGSSGGGSTTSGDGAEPTTAGGPAQHPASLVAEVGKDDAYEISLKDPDETAFLAAGTYKLKVEDYSTIHNFHLMGGSVNEATTVAEKTEKTFTVNLTPGDYTFQCDPHASQMSGSFHVS